MKLFWIDTLTRNAVHALELLSFKRSTSPSTPHSGEIGMSQKNIWFHCEMMSDQEKGFPPMPYILNVRFFSFKSLISIRKTNYFIRWIETYPVLYRYPPFEKTATWTFQDYTYRRKYNSIKNVVWPKHLLFLHAHALVFDWKRYCRMSKEKRKTLYSFCMISMAACMRRGRGVLKGLVMWAADGNIFIQKKSNQGTPFDQLLSKNLFDGFEINKQHLSCSECFN